LSLALAARWEVSFFDSALTRAAGGEILGEMRSLLFGIVPVLTLLASVASGGEAEPLSRTNHTLFSPTPREQMREWTTDRGGVSPYTLDAGHFEAEIWMVGYGYRKQNFEANDNLITSSGQVLSTTQVSATRTTQGWDFGYMVIKAGLLDRLDVEIILTPYTTRTVVTDFAAPHFAAPYSAQTFAATERTSTVSGFGDTSARLKLNVWGNDGGTTALSFSGTVKFPTADAQIGNGQFEGGPAVEFAAKLPWGFGVRVYSGVDLYESGTGDREVAFENLLGITHKIVGRLDGFCEFDTWTFTDSAAWRATVLPGVSYRLLANAELFAGASFGLHGSVFDYYPLLGFDVRF
jgi:hypothetical protein